MTGSRTVKSIKNSIIALIMYFINLILSFFSRKVFLDYLGTDILGLNTTAMNLLQFLNLAELGIGSAIAFTLYKPIFEKNTNQINEIIWLQGWLYKKVAIFVIIGAIILVPFFPIIFGKIDLPLWYTYASFGVLLFSSLLSYFVNYKQVILTADQKDFKIQIFYKGVQLLKILFQIFAVSYFPNGYIYWLLSEGIFAILSSISLNWIIKKDYPYLKKPNNSAKDLRKKYPDIVIKIKQLFFHRIGGLVLNQSSPLIIYAYTSLSTVALYGNYQIIINGLYSLFNAIFNSIGGGVGNLIASGDNDRIIQVFNELFSLRFLIIFTMCIDLYIYVPSFINIWIGDKYILSESTLLLMIGYLYLMCSRYTVDNFVNGFGLYSDIYAPVIESVLNIGLSIVFGYFYGLNGVLSGVLISLFIMVFIWKPYFLFSRKLPKYLAKYFIFYFKHIIAGILTCIIILNLVHKMNLLYPKTWDMMILSVAFISIVCIVVLATVLLVFNCGLKNTINRFKKQS